MTDFTHGQSDRDELARLIEADSNYLRDLDGYGWVLDGKLAADAAIAAGWRKKPEREAIARAIASGLDGWNDFDAASDDYKRELLEGADAVLALMDGPTEAGESK